MAIVRIQNATIERVFSGGKGYAIAENFIKRDGTEGKSAWTLWFDEPQELAVGDKGNFSGLYSDKIEEFEGREGNTVRTVRRNINSAKVDGELVSAGAGGFAGDAENPF